MISRVFPWKFLQIHITSVSDCMCFTVKTCQIAAGTIMIRQFHDFFNLVFGGFLTFVTTVCWCLVVTVEPVSLGFAHNSSSSCTTKGRCRRKRRHRRHSAAPPPTSAAPPAASAQCRRRHRRRHRHSAAPPPPTLSPSLLLPATLQGRCTCRNSRLTFTFPTCFHS